MVTCQLNWILNKRSIMPFTMEDPRVGCWKLLGYNTDKFLSSTVFQNSQDGRCILSFSGYHGALAGYARGSSALTFPPQTWNACGHDFYAPYVRLLRHHAALSNFSKLMDTIAGPESPCKGELSFAAESMGGSCGEMLATCANQGRLKELLPQSKLDGFKLQNLYSFGTPAASATPMTNSLREDGCFKGKRIFLAADPIARFGTIYNMKHPRMDAVEIWPNGNGTNPSVQVYPCKAESTIHDDEHVKPAALVAELAYSVPNDGLQHEVATYEAILDWMQRAGKGSVIDSDLSQDKPPESTSSKYLALLQQGAQ